mmetsp:Transcript_20505/g.44279  ORF Transcript_20505/g.44279 Transcript_20505/m.44279 type:complete len:111 (-) Transcript_20505:837-1169(-)
MSSNKYNASNKAPSLLEESKTNNGELAPTGFKFSYVGVTHRSRRGKFQARIYKNNKEYNLGTLSRRETVCSVDILPRTNVQLRSTLSPYHAQMLLCVDLSQLLIVVSPTC